MGEKGIFVDQSVVKEKPKQISTDFLTPILDKPLTVERIDNYVDDAVNELIFLVNQKVDDYKSSHNTGGWDDKTIEDTALRFYGLESIGDYLDFLAEKDAEIRGLDRVIKKAEQVHRVIIPPDSYDPHIGGNGGEMAEKKMISRVKTVLFILKEDFEVDVDNEDELVLKEGVVRDNMMRKSSYFLISVPKIDRTLLVCDEEGNASYVFNNKVLKDREIFEDILVNLTKEELNELIQQTPELGKRVIYSKDYFVPRIISAIESPDGKRPDEVSKETGDMGKYLYPRPINGEESFSGLLRKFKIGNNKLQSIIQAMNTEELGVVNKYCFGRINVNFGYTLEQQEKIIQKGEAMGKIAPEPVNGELAFTVLCKKLCIEKEALQSIIQDIPSEVLGVVKKYDFRGVITYGYTLEQQEKIIQKGEAMGKIAPEPVNGELAFTVLYIKLKIGPKVLQSILDAMNPEDLGIVGSYRFGVKVRLGYTLEQQEKIIQKGEAMGKIAPEPVNGELTRSVLSEKLKVAPEVLQEVIDTLGSEELGIINLYRFGKGAPSSGYTLEQQEKIIQKGEAMGKIAPEPVNGELSNNGFAKKLGLSWRMVQKVINAVNQKSFGIVGLYRFGVNAHLGYTLEQQWMVIDYIREHKRKLISEDKWRELDEEKKKWMESKSKE